MRFLFLDDLIRGNALKKKKEEEAQPRERIKHNSFEISQHKHGHLQTMNGGTMSANHPACLVAMVPGLPDGALSLRCGVCVLPAEGVELLADILVQDVLDVGSLQLGRRGFVPGRRWCYLQIASRASRVRLMSRICAARVCMGCMERSNSSQRAISVYMPFILMSTDSPRLSTESL